MSTLAEDRLTDLNAITLDSPAGGAFYRVAKVMGPGYDSRNIRGIDEKLFLQSEARSIPQKPMNHITLREIAAMSMVDLEDLLNGNDKAREIVLETVDFATKQSAAALKLK